MSDDLLLCDKLRAIYPEHKNVNQWDVRYEAAERILLHKAEITRLRADNERLREALRPFADMANGEYITDEKIRAALEGVMKP